MDNVNRAMKPLFFCQALFLFFDCRESTETVNSIYWDTKEYFDADIAKYNEESCKKVCLHTHTFFLVHTSFGSG